VRQEHTAVPQSWPLAPARSEVEGNILGPLVREIPSPGLDDDLHPIKRTNFRKRPAALHCAVLSTGWPRCHP
jgi:hypothetical protein